MAYSLQAEVPQETKLQNFSLARNGLNLRLCLPLYRGKNYVEIICKPTFSLTMNYVESMGKLFVFGGFNGRGSSDKVYGLEVNEEKFGDAWKSEGTLHGPRDSHESIAISEGDCLKL